MNKEERFWFLKYTIKFSETESKVFRTRVKAFSKQEAENKLKDFVRSKVEVSVKENEEGFSDSEIDSVQKGLDAILDIFKACVPKGK